MLGGRAEGHMSFGFGRRICSGRYVAEGTLAIGLLTLVWTMRFEHPEGVQGELALRTIVNSSIVAYVAFACFFECILKLLTKHSHPIPFENFLRCCKITVRIDTISEFHGRLVR